MENRNQPLSKAWVQPTLEEFREWNRAQNDHSEPCEMFVKWLEHLEAEGKKENDEARVFKVSWVHLLFFLAMATGAPLWQYVLLVIVLQLIFISVGLDSGDLTARTQP